MDQFYQRFDGAKTKENYLEIQDIITRNRLSIVQYPLYDKKKSKGGHGHNGEEIEQDLDNENEIKEKDYGEVDWNKYVYNVDDFRYSKVKDHSRYATYDHVNSPTDVIKECLRKFEQTGIFSCGGTVCDAPSPGIYINNIGYLGLSILEGPIQRIIQNNMISSEDMDVDSEIHQPWQLEPSQFEIKHSKWDSMMNTIVHHISCKLGCDPKSVKHSLNKLIIYGPGSFFKPQSNIKKEKSIFGNLIIKLPSIYSGGQLVIRHSQEKYEYDFSDTDSSLETNYASFHVDCEYEIKPITTGYCVCLIYDLVNTDPEITPTIKNDTAMTQEIIKVVNDWISNANLCRGLLIYGLENFYTDERLFVNGLKGKDAAILRMLQTVSNSVPLDIYLVNMEWNEDSLALSINTWFPKANDSLRRIFVQVRDIVQPNFWKGKKCYDRSNVDGSNEQISYHSRIIFWPTKIKHRKFLRRGITKSITYLREIVNTLEASDICGLLSAILHINTRVRGNCKGLIEFIKFLVDFDCREQVIEFISYINIRMTEIRKKYLIRIVNRLHESFPIISTNPTFLEIVSYILSTFSREEDLTADTKNTIIKLKKILDAEFSEETTLS